MYNGEEYLMDLEKIKKIRENCQKRDEPILEYYCNCMLKMRRTYHKTEQTELLFYIRKIMKAAFPLVITYFGNIIENYHKETDSKKRAELLREIEDSVVEFDGMFDSIIHATNNVDRILFQTAPIATLTHCTAPKLCAYYSEMLNQLATLLSETDKYGFCVYPTLNSSANAMILFSSVEETGKVVIIRVPARSIADIEQMQVYLLHELFHVIPGEDLRCRKKRADLFIHQILYDIKESIFYDCDFSFLAPSSCKTDKSNGQTDRDHKIKDKVMSFYFQNIKDKIQNDINKDGPRAYYSARVKNTCMKVFYDSFFDIFKNKNMGLFEILLEEYTGEFHNYKEYAVIYKKIEEMCRRIEANLNEYVVSNKLSRSCEFYMCVFRETFADLMMLTTLGLEREKYLDALKSTDQAKIYEELFTVIRYYLVQRAMKELHNGSSDNTWKIPDEWETYISELAKKDTQDSQVAEKIQQLADGNQWKGETNINQIILDYYVGYLKECVLHYRKKVENFEVQYENFVKKFLYNKEENMIQKVCCREW